jgi:RHS repeat-associated protein
MYTGKEQDATGLYYFNARYYDPETGKFITRDPYTFLPNDPRIIGKPQNRAQWLMNPQRFDRFSYAQNNPLRYQDPTGLSFTYCDPQGELLCDGDQTHAIPGEGGQEDPPSQNQILIQMIQRTMNTKPEQRNAKIAIAKTDQISKL